MELRPEGYAIDKRFPDIIYVPRGVRFNLHSQTVSWPTADGEHSLKYLLADKIYVPCQPQSANGKARRAAPGGLIGTAAEGTLCHKPCTVSGGGKSEISKPIRDAIIQGPTFVADFKKDFNQVARMLKRDFSDRFRDPSKNGTDKRSILQSRTFAWLGHQVVHAVRTRVFG